MKQFITGPAPDYKVVNLKEVTNIAFEIYTNREGKTVYKIIFNFNVPVSLKNNIIKIIPDYMYFVYYDEEEYQKTVDILNDLINESMWLAPSIDGRVKRIINPDKITFIARDPRHNRIIVNLSTSISFYSDYKRRTSDFIYFDFTDPEEFEAEYQYMMEQLNLKEL